MQLHKFVRPHVARRDRDRDRGNIKEDFMKFLAKMLLFQQCYSANTHCPIEREKAVAKAKEKKIYRKMERKKKTVREQDD